MEMDERYILKERAREVAVTRSIGWKAKRSLLGAWEDGERTVMVKASCQDLFDYRFKSLYGCLWYCLGSDNRDTRVR